MKVISFNVNSIRARLHQLEAIIERFEPDVIGLQETKVRDEEFPLDWVEQAGYCAAYHGQKTHYGVALLTKNSPSWTTKGFPDDDEDAQRRFISCGIQDPATQKEVVICNGYFPQGESRDHATKFPAKEKFYRNVIEQVGHYQSQATPLILMGDMNIAPADDDIGIGEDNRKRWLRTGKCSFLPEEREWLQTVMDLGLVDSFRALQPEESTYSWFDYRSRGFERDPRRGLRIDLILATPDLISRTTSVGIDYDVRGMEKPSDHCPIWMEWS